MNSLKPLIKLMRPTQWIKNGFVFMPLVFSGKLFVADDVIKVSGMCLAFCLTSSAAYMLNDYMDMEQDRVHPLKKTRPLASGEVSPGSALLFMFGLLLGAVLLAGVARLPLPAYGFLAAYLVLQILYSLKLKNLVILDVLTISTGFLLRVLGGAAAMGASVSSWLVLCTFSVAIFLALGKRRHEMVMLTDDATSHRPVLENYNVALLDQLLQIVATSTFIFYCLYSVLGNPAAGIQAEKMTFTIPLVTYGIFRYMYLIYRREDGGSPTALLLTDSPLLLCTIIWLVACIAVIYHF
ncbi:MAG TPA: decaprenyl-phosphate phosphoribosyltransferase [Desulfomonilaceae bacterium]|nr:decaprenyl-phosphate phosphoribosyltransferase [Desulfomonilaceae bacterium]